MMRDMLYRDSINPRMAADGMAASASAGSVNGNSARMAGKSSGAGQKKPTPSGKKKVSPLVRRQRQAWFRILIQIIFFIYAPSVYNSAFTAIKNAFTSIGQGQPLELTSFSAQLIMVVAYTILFGRFFCGWACAFGALNDWVYRFFQFLFKKIGVKTPKLPNLAISILQWLKYIVLVAILVICFLGQGSQVNQNSPWTAFSLIRSANFAQLGSVTIAIVLLLILIVGMIFHERFFCQFFCPMGAVFSLLPAMPILRLKRHSETCPAKCGACRKVCPVNLLMEDNSLKQGECIRCGRCSGICPRGNISTLIKFRGDEFWLDAVKAVILLVLITVVNHIM